PRFRFDQTDFEQIEHRRRGQLAGEHLPEVVEAAETLPGVYERHVLESFWIRGASPRRISGACACSSRRTRYRILPTALIGSVSRISTSRGTLYSVRLARQCAINSAAAAAVPGLNATQALMISP